jgi:hypothetical protein
MLLSSDYSSVLLMGLASNRTVLYDNHHCRWCHDDKYLDSFFEPLSACQHQYSALAAQSAAGVEALFQPDAAVVAVDFAGKPPSIDDALFPHWLWQSMASVHSAAVTYTNSTDGALLSEEAVAAAYGPELLLALKLSVLRALLAKVSEHTLSTLYACTRVL